MVSVRLSEVAEPYRPEPRCPAYGEVPPWRDGFEPSVVRTWCRLLRGALDSFSKPSPLILDDFLITPIESSLNVVDLFETLEAREGRASTLLVSQLESGK